MLALDALAWTLDMAIGALNTLKRSVSAAARRISSKLDKKLDNERFYQNLVGHACGAHRLRVLVEPTRVVCACYLLRGPFSATLMN